MYQFPDFREILCIVRNCYLKASKISGKNVDKGKNGITLSEETPNHNFTSSY